MTTKQRKPMKVRVTTTIYVDRDKYEAEYGEPFTDADIREDVKSRVYETIKPEFERFGDIYGIEPQS